MGKKVVQACLWILSGMVLMGIIVWFTMPSLMLIEHKSLWNYEETMAALNDVIKKKQDWKRDRKRMQRQQRKKGQPF